MFRNVRSRILLFLFVAALGSELSVASTPTCLAPPNGLVSWWTGDTDETDFYGVNNPLAVNAITIVPAEVSNGFQINGGGYIDIPDSSTLDNQKFTWVAWVEPLGPGPNDDQYGSVIVAKNLDNTHASFVLNWRDNPDNRFVYITGDQFSQVIYSTDTFAPGVFYFVAGTYDGVTFKLYVNGVLEGSLAETTKINYSSSHTWEIGSGDSILRSEGFSRTFNGVIDEVQGYKTALAVTQIANIYKAGATGVCKAPVVLTPTSESFASQAVGTTSPSKTVSVINNRSTGITLDGFTLSGADPADFAVSSTTCGGSLAGRAKCTVSVTFTPQAIGKRAATLNVNDSAAGSPPTVSLSGTGK